MKNGTKNFSLMMVLMFVVGQIQYGYTTYFCTMLNEFVPSPAMTLAVQHEGDACGQCGGVFASHHENQTFEPNCFKINSVQKDVVSTFTSSSNPDSFSITTVAFIVPRLLFQQNVHWKFIVAPDAQSPPQDLLTFNRSLRI